MSPVVMLDPMAGQLGCSLHLQDLYSESSPVATLADVLPRGRHCYWLMRNIVVLMFPKQA